MNLTINKLTIENFAGFKKQTFEFNGQDARVYGANGTGKTTTATAPVAYTHLTLPTNREV